MQSSRRQFLSVLASAAAASAQTRPPIVGVRADTATPRSESGVGALMPWADALWAVTYNSHTARTGTGLGLYRIDEKLAMERVHVHNGTHANRFIHSASDQCFIGPYAIDAKGNWRFIESFANERLTATMAHLADPANRVYMLTMEGLLYDLDVRTLQRRLILDLVKQFNINRQPHFKGGHTGQGRVVVANNTFSKWNESDGTLAEWDGKDWRLLSRKPHMEVAGRANMGDAIFATGWDEASAVLRVLIEGQWRTYRLPKASHTFDQFWQTEWTRIREVETERYLMDCHGMFYELSPMIFEKSVWGVNPICAHLRVIPDYCSFSGMLVLAGNETTPNQDVNATVGQPQSGMWFGKTDDLWRFGKPKGWGGPWRRSQVKANQPSDPFLMTGFDRKMVHLQAAKPVDIQVDFTGMGEWVPAGRMVPGPSGYDRYIFPDGFSAHWVRLVPTADGEATAEFFYT